MAVDENVASEDRCQPASTAAQSSVFTAAALPARSRLISFCRAESAGGCFFPVELFVLEPIDRAIEPGLRNRHVQLGVTDDDAREGEPCLFIPLFGRVFESQRFLQGRD